MIGALISFVRHLREARRIRQRVVAALARHRGEIVEHVGLRVDLVVLAGALSAVGRDADAEKLLAEPTISLVRAVRRLAIIAIDRPRPVPGLLDFACDVCGRRYLGNQLVMHREENFPLSATEGRCPTGHTLPALPSETVIQ